MLLLCLLASDPGEIVLDRPVPELVTTGKFRGELERGLSASWRNIDLRTVLRRIADDRKMAIVLDRGVDPNREVAFEFVNAPVLEALETIAADAGAAVSVLENAVYLGPPERAAKLRTLIALRTEELLAESSGVPKSRQFELSERRTFHWNDLDRPADLLDEIAKRYKLTIDGLDRIPHDLWAGGTLPNANSAEALSIVLIQFDLTFIWTDRGAGVRLVPVPEAVTIERTYTPRGLTAAVAAARWPEEIEGLAVEVSGTKVVVRGTAEQHAAVEDLLRPGSRKTTAKTATPGDLKRRLFTMRTERAPARAILAELEKGGITIRYNADELKKAGIDLDTLVNLDLKKASAEELFTKLCEPLGCRYAIEGTTATLSPK